MINLNRREKQAVLGATICLGLFLVLQLGVFPLMSKRARLERAREVKTEVLAQMRAMQSEYEAFQGKADAVKASLANREKDFSLFSFLDRLVGEVGIRENISYMKPSTSFQKDRGIKVATVELKLQAVTLEQLTQYLYRVEHSENNLVLKRMSVSETSKPEGFINVVLQVETIEA